MTPRRRKGATLGLVAICVLVLIVVGTAVYFLVKILGGGREIANATDAGALNVAKHIIRDARVATVTPFEDCEYPLGCGYINLLTYNRCVAKAIMICGNAANMTGPGDYKAHADAVVDKLEAMGTALSAKIKDSNLYFNDVNNTVRMASFAGIKNDDPCKVAYMKPSGPTNIFFNGQQLLSGVTIPISTTSMGPKNQNSYVAAGTGQGYMAGYAPITVMGRTIFGVPVFPQQNPHLVSGFDFNSSGTPFGSAPPNAVELGSKTTEMKTNMLTGAIACAIVGAVENGSPGSGGSSVGQSLLGSGFQFPAASSFGYLEFGNYPANQTPPGYDPKDYGDNIFNNELMEGGFNAYGDQAATQMSDYVTYSTDLLAPTMWINYAKGIKDAQKKVADDEAKLGLPATTPAITPPSVSIPGVTYAGAYNADLSGNPISMSNPPNQATIDILAKMNLSKPESCFLDLATEGGLMGACVAALPSMQSTYKHKVPDLNPGGSQLFSQADWAKATLLTEFEGRNPRSIGGRDGVPTYNNSATVNLTVGAPTSGLGVYPAALVPGQVPAIPPNMPTPEYTLPLEAPGSIRKLIQAVQTPGCATDTIAAIANRCKQIQPMTSDADVNTLLDKVLPMAAPASPSWDNARKLYIYLPGGDLSAPLIISESPPPKLTGNAPDGCCTYPNSTTACYKNTYYLDGNIVDSTNDQKVHMRPYLEMDAGNPLRCIDHADWQPGSGADNNFGRMTFTEVGLGSTTFTHIN
ncbi:MAG: hypothetical protein JST89_08970 [Cyanobacteria bacterium SZAS-4]|nr:hypothetical protein [Cyanobacteria bacterium SZAS-4]